MIRSFEVKQPEHTHVPWWTKVETLAQPRRFDFKPGLNILWGKNGSGKSTLILAMARLLHCYQGGVPAITERSLRDMFDQVAASGEKLFSSRLIESVILDHDGQGVRFCDPSIVVGIADGQFDFDFIREGISNKMARASAGQTTTMRISDLVHAVVSRSEAPKVVRHIDTSNANDLWGRRIRTAGQYLAGSGDLGPPTILLDEPDRSLDMPTQLDMWSFLRAAAREFQVIVASHTTFALGLEEANYIEMTPGYLEQCNKVLNTMDEYRSTVRFMPKKGARKQGAPNV